MSKPHLVICRPGDNSLHREWMGDPATRSYDVWLDAWREGDRQYAQDPVRFSIGPNTMKWPRIAALLAEREAELGAYEAVWCPDPDVSIGAAGVEAMFRLFRELRLDLAQPALRKDSYRSFYINLAHRTFTARFTNYVEVMAPIFSPRALAACRPTFTQTVSGWGIDFIWPKLLGYPRDRIAILDAVPMTHTRPVGGGGWYEQLPRHPSEEMADLLQRHGICQPYAFRQFGGIPRWSARRLNAGLAFFLLAALGAPPNVALHKTYWRAQWASILDIATRSEVGNVPEP